jgi:hypothetical protein
MIHVKCIPDWQNYRSDVLASRMGGGVAVAARRAQQHTHFGMEHPGMDLGSIELTNNAELGETQNDYAPQSSATL